MNQVRGILPPGSDGPGAAGAVLCAEWALWGKSASDREYRLLRCTSGGTFRPRDFTYAIDRYSPGTLGYRALPQAGVSWLPHPVTGTPSHVAIAFYETAAAAPAGEQPRSRFDAAGREIAYVRYFCVPYAELARRAVTYQQLHDTFRGQPVPRHSRETADASLAPSRIPAQDDNGTRRLAARVAAQLLTSRPVCILGAGSLTAEERLRFIDLVMSWLPYGARSQMSAATWTNPNSTGHRQRLFFTSAPRDDPRSPSREPSGRVKRDINVTWGREPEAPAGEQVTAYLRWRERYGPAARDRLALETSPASLKNEESVSVMLRRLHAEHGPAMPVTGPSGHRCQSSPPLDRRKRGRGPRP